MPFVFDRSSVRRIADTVRTVENPSANRISDKTRVGYRALNRGRTLGVVNITANTVPQGAILWLEERENTGLFAFTKPEYPGISNFAVASSPIEAGGEGSAIVSGMAEVLLDSGYSLGSILLWGRWGPIANSWKVKTMLLGPMLAVGKNTHTGLLIVRLDKPQFLAH